MGVRVGFGHSVRSGQIATEKRKGKIGFILAINESNEKIAEPCGDGLGESLSLPSHSALRIRHNGIMSTKLFSNCYGYKRPYEIEIAVRQDTPHEFNGTKFTIQMLLWSSLQYERKVY